MITPCALRFLADGERFAVGCGARLESDAELSLIPEITCIEYRSLTENDLSVLSCARYVEARLPDGVYLCGGTPDDIETVSRGGVRVTTVTLVASPDFYRKTVSLTVRAGATYRELLGALMRPAGIKTPAPNAMLDRVLPRPRSFCGAVSEAVDEVICELGADACLRRGRLYIRSAVTGRLKTILTEPADILPGDMYEGRLIFRRRLTIDTTGSVRQMRLEAVRDDNAKVS